MKITFSYYNAKELAAACGVSLRTVEGWRYRNKGPEYTKFLDGSIRYPRKSAESFIAAYLGTALSSQEGEDECK